jgi:hypothetical protein
MSRDTLAYNTAAVPDIFTLPDGTVVVLECIDAVGEVDGLLAYVIRLRSGPMLVQRDVGQSPDDVHADRLKLISALHRCRARP